MKNTKVSEANAYEPATPSQLRLKFKLEIVPGARRPRKLATANCIQRLIKDATLRRKQEEERKRARDLKQTRRISTAGGKHVQRKSRELCRT